MATGEITKKKSLYELTELSQQIEDLIVQFRESGEDYSTLTTALGQLEAERLTKIEGIFRLLQWREKRIEAIKEEKARLNQVQNRLEADNDWLEQYCVKNMEEHNESKLIFSLVKGSVRNNPPSVEVIDESLIPDTFLRIKTVTEINKTDILNRFRAGTIKEVAGAKIVTDRKSLIIK
jgi:hypothetical protein